MILVDSIISGFISKIISDCVDISPYTIKNADNNRKSNEQNLQTKIYQVIIDVLNKITNNTYKNQEIIYIAAEKILNGFKNNDKDVVQAIKSGLNIINNIVSNDECQEFIKILYQEISKEKNINLYREILLLLLQQANQQNEQNYTEVKQIKEQLELINIKLSKHDVENTKIEIQQKMKFQNNKKQKYIDNWNSRLFLHLDNEENPITLAQSFIMPNYKIHEFIRTIKLTYNDNFNSIINKFKQYNKTSTMLIMGVPGIGKSTITSWLANRYKSNDDVIILRFRDWDNTQLKDGLLNAIYTMLCCKKQDLENKILILDGFDEIKCLYERDFLLNIFMNNIKDFDNFKIIITSRSNYIDSIYFQTIIELQVFDITKVEKFYKIITGKNLGKTELNLEILGIPVILYMAIMSNVDISKNLTKPKLYNLIFAKKEGIFDKFSEYDNGSQILRNPENIKKYLTILQQIAFKMFEKNELRLNKSDYEIPPLEFNGNYVSILEFPIKYLFENTESNIEFIHKSIYEYFISEYIFTSINQEINKKSSNKELSKSLGNILIKNYLSSEILEFLSFKIKNSKLKDSFNLINNTFNLMLQNGMTYYTKIYYKNIIHCEMIVFINMLEFLHLWEINKFKFNEKITDYIKCNHKMNLNLKAVNLRKFNLEGADLRKANLEGADLSAASLKDTNLREANLKAANLKGIFLTNANLEKCNLEEANLDTANLREANLKRANLREANLKKANLIKVNLEEANLNKANLNKANLSGANLNATDLSEADLSEVNLSETYLDDVNLRSTNLSGANLNKVNLSRANLIDTKLNTANLIDTIFSQNQIEYLKKNYNLENSTVYIEKTNNLINYKKKKKLFNKIF